MLNINDYPLSTRRSEIIYTPSGKNIEDFNIDNVLSGHIDSNDCRISPQTLEYQAQIAEQVGNLQMANNLRRAAELTNVSDDMVMNIYNALRPFRSTKQELMNISDELKEKYGANLCAEFIREAAIAYEKGNKLKK